jgi:RNA-directed DNA polymerase
VPKRYKDLWRALVSFPNLLQAFERARKGKRSRPDVAAFERDLEPGLLRLHEELTAGTYRPGPYRTFEIHDPKRRLISAAPFRDRVVHHALTNVIEPLFDRSFLYDSYANRLGKGTHAALRRCKLYVRRFPCVLKMDVEKYFPNVDHEILLSLLARRIGDPRVLGLARAILASGEGILDGEAPFRYFPGDDLFAVNRPRGLPLGNQTSQFFANVYLDPLDRFVKQRLGAPGYLRYVDDFLLFAREKAVLHRWKGEIAIFLERLRLRAHPRKCAVLPVRCGVPFVGFRVFPGRTLLRREAVRRFVRRMKGFQRARREGQIRLADVGTSVRSYLAHAAHADAASLNRALLRQFVF